MYLHVYAKKQRNHSCTSKLQKTPHFGQFRNGTLLFHFCNRNKTEPREVTKQVVWIILRNRIFHGTIRSGFPIHARTLCALTLLAYALKSRCVNQFLAQYICLFGLLTGDYPKPIINNSVFNCVFYRLTTQFSKYHI